MYELIYCSVATKLITIEDLNAILTTSRRWNAEKNVTGMLVYYGKTREFVQWLEGDKEAVLSLYNDRLLKDKRHTSLETLNQGPITERHFKDWNMSFCHLDNFNPDEIKEFSPFADKGFTNELINDRPSKTKNLMLSLRDHAI